MPKCVIFEDEHLLVVNKPAGLNTHSPHPHAGEGIYEWLKNREPRWRNLSILHRLDKETSGILVFGLSQAANRSLTDQFTQHTIRKKYVFLTDRNAPPGKTTVVSALARSGEKYLSRPMHAGGLRAETCFRLIGKSGEITKVEAMPVTGRTHQIRAQAAAQGFPILGDALYGGTPAQRVFLHAAEITLLHPGTGKTLTFQVPPEFEADPRWPLREALLEQPSTLAGETNAFRLIHGAADGWEQWYVDRLGDYLLSQSPNDLAPRQRVELERQASRHAARGVYHKKLSRHLNRGGQSDSSPGLVFGEAAPDAFTIRENNAKFELSFKEGYSVGLFLDQRDNRRRFLLNHIGADFPLFADGAAGREVLNTFAYTCGFSVCAALAGARVTSLDLSKKYLEWGRRNFTLNNLDPAAHDFIFGDTFDWLRRLARKGRRFDAVILDPPTFSHSKAHGTFQAEKDYAALVRAALPVLKPGGVLLASSNAARLAPGKFMTAAASAIQAERRSIKRELYIPQPPDFPIHREEPAYLKTLWLRVH